MKCLEVGDFAVIQKGDYKPNITETDFSVLCRNGSIAQYNGFDVDEDCALTTIVGGEVATRRDNPKAKDIKVALAVFEDKFLIYAPFKVFNVFNGTKDLLFPDSTSGLTSEKSGNKYVQNYIKMLNELKQCKNEPGAASTMGVSFFLLILSVLPFIRF